MIKSLKYFASCDFPYERVEGYRLERVFNFSSADIFVDDGHDPSNSQRFNNATFSVSLYKKNNYSDWFMEYVPTTEYEKNKFYILAFARLIGDTDENFNTEALKFFKKWYGPGGEEGHASSFIKLENGKSSFEKWINLFKEYEKNIWE